MSLVGWFVGHPESVADFRISVWLFKTSCTH